MYIESIELVGFKRMMLNGTTYFRMEMTEPIQQILGTNGSGKSSLIRELSPLPAEPANYTKEGSKVITITHDGHRYVLKSWFSIGNKHSFIRDGEELNPGHTLRVQEDLVRREFRITKSIRDLQVGEISFTRMGPTQRREWFTLLSDEDFTYALTVFKSLAKKARDIAGAIEINKRRLVTESAKIITPEEERKLQAEVNEIHRDLNILIENKRPIERSSEELQREAQNIETQIKSLSALVKALNPTNEDGQPYTLEEVDQKITEVERGIAATEALIAKYSQDHKSLEEKVALLKKTGEQDLNSLTVKNEVLTQARLELLARKKLPIEGFDAHAAHNAFLNVQDQLAQILSAIPENEDKRINRDSHQALKADILARKDRFNIESVELRKLQARLEHMVEHQKTAKETTCPRCHHRWIDGFSEAVLAALKTETQEKAELVAVLETEIKELEEKLAVFNAFSDYYWQFIRMTQSWNALKPFWDYLIAEELVIKYPRRALNLLSVLNADLMTELEIKKLDDEIAQNRTLITELAMMGDTNIAEVTGSLTECEAKIGDLTYELRNYQARLTDYRVYRRTVQEALGYRDAITRLMEEFVANRDESIKTLRSEIINTTIRTLQSRLAQKEDILSHVTSHRNRIADIEMQIEELSKQKVAADLLVRELSPTEGLIAEGLFASIKLSLAQMNAMIRKVWAYPLVIQNCKLDTESGTELDYKFPLVVHHADNIVPDVANGSTGMKEIVDLAFMVTAMKRLGMGNYPIFIDEFSHSFDEAHRGAAVELVKNLIDQYAFNQLFMISHYLTLHGAITNAEICVLCENNITVPEHTRYNLHVTME